MSAVPWERIKTLFLDVGNTLTSIDFAWLADELGSRGLVVEVDVLRRAEARARPAISRRFEDGTVVDRVFSNYLAAILEHLPESRRPEPASCRALATQLEPVLWQPGEAHRLWRSPMPRAREALERAAALGLQRIAVSNSDGTAHLSLEAAGLLELVPEVVDSARVGFEKPDPRIFEVALERSGAARESVLHVGDLPFADVLGAKRAGLAVVLLDPHDDFGERDCARLPDLWSVVERIERARSGR